MIRGSSVYGGASKALTTFNGKSVRYAALYNNWKSVHRRKLALDFFPAVLHRTPRDLFNNNNAASLDPSIDDENNSTQSTSSGCKWIISSPIYSLSIKQRLKEWLLRCWKQIRKICYVTIRASEITVRLFPLAILFPSAALFGSRVISDVAWRYTIISIQQLGPVAIKLCQWASTRRDIFPPTFCNHLSILQDRGCAHSFKWTEKVLTGSFGDYESKGLVIEEVVGCGSAAQVYRGTLTTTTSSTTTTTRNVAIKVLHPRFQELIERDLDFMKMIADFLDQLPSDHLKMLNLPRAIEDFAAVLRNQSNLIFEADNLRQFRENFYKNSQKAEDKSSIVFPQPIDGWISSNALVEDYIHDSVPIVNFLLDSSEEGMKNRKDLAGKILSAFLKMVFIDNFIHGDLHPGNVLVTTTLIPVSNSSIFPKFKHEEESIYVKRSIVFLDAGIAISLSKNDQRNLIDLFRSVVFNNGNRAGRLMVERAKYERCSQIPDGIDKFSKGIEEIVSEFHDRRKEGLTLGAVRIGVLLTRVLDLCRIHGVEIDPAMASVVISTLVLEGLGRSLSPDLDLISFARPFVLGRGSP